MNLRRALVATLILVGCGPEFEKPSLVTGPRVLGIVADPPEVAFSEGTRLEAVIAFPEKVSSLSWTWCPLSLGASMGYKCAVPEVPNPDSSPTITFDATTLGTMLEGMRPQFGQLVPFLRQTVRQSDVCLRDVIGQWDACNGQSPCADEVFNAFMGCLHAGGVGVTFHLHLQLEDGTAMEAYKAVLVRDPGPSRNHNPPLSGVEVTHSIVHKDEVTHSIPGNKLEMKVVPGPGAVEEYTDQEGNLQKERVFFTWYTTTGDFEHTRSTPEAPENTLKLPPERPDEITIWVFALDDRGGASYVRFFVHKRLMQ